VFCTACQQGLLTEFAKFFALHRVHLAHAQPTVARVARHLLKCMFSMVSFALWVGAGCRRVLRGVSALHPISTAVFVGGFFEKWLRSSESSDKPVVRPAPSRMPM
jgi:hypothetical protein